MFPGQFVAAAITRREQFILVVRSPIPYGADSMEYIACRKAISLRHLRIHGAAAMQHAALELQFSSCCTMNGTIDTPSTQQRCIRSIDDCIYLLPRDIPLNNFDLHGITDLLSNYSSLPQVSLPTPRPHAGRADVRPPGHARQPSPL